MASRSINVGELIDTGKMSAFQYWVLALCICVNFIDGYDVQSMAYVGPAIVKGWHVSKAVITPALTSGVVGTVIGTLALGPLADIFGRRKVILYCLVLACLGSFGTIFCHSIWALTTLRFITGLGIGGSYPNAVSLTSEYSSRRSQALMVVGAVCGNSAGGAIGGSIAAGIIPAFGWESVFFVGGLIPLALLPLLYFQLPESVRFLIIKQRQPGEVARLVGRMRPQLGITAETRFHIEEVRTEKASVGELFTGNRSSMTLLVWAMWFTNLIGMFFLSTWLPTVTNDAGLSVERAVMAASLLHMGGIIGCLGFGLVVRRLNPCGAISAFYFSGAVSIVLLGMVASQPSAVLIMAFIAGFCVIGSQISANAVTTRLYPTSIGATGMSWAFGIGRAGSMLGPMLGGLLLSFKLDVQSLFLVAAVPGTLAALSAFMLMRNSAARANMKAYDEQQSAFMAEEKQAL
ncbi:MAG TPA: MFS transporter [Stellaceae bacterium]|jgi:AAHS family 4-hydroxybenzoate transporter-like MFS transporter|nr:MFS transporter [Stellaceae bacterium]